MAKLLNFSWVMTMGILRKTPEVHNLRNFLTEVNALRTLSCMILKSIWSSLKNYVSTSDLKNVGCSLRQSQSPGYCLFTTFIIVGLLNKLEKFSNPSNSFARSHSRVLVPEGIKCSISDTHSASNKRLSNPFRSCTLNVARAYI